MTIISWRFMSSLFPLKALEGGVEVVPATDNSSNHRLAFVAAEAALRLRKSRVNQN